MAEAVCSRCGLRPERTQRGRLPPWEVAKACAYDTVIKHISSVLGEPAHHLLGKSVAEFIAEQLTLVGGGAPSKRAVLHTLATCKDGEYYPGRPRTNPGGRPREVTDHQEREVARAAMELKKCRLSPSPVRVRAKLPRLAMNRATGKPISDNRIRDVFKLRCYDETEDDPWQWLPNPSKDYLSDQMVASRLRTAKYILANFSANAWATHIAIDPCSSLLPRYPQRLEDQQVAAMGKNKWRSKRSPMDSVNARAPETAKKQAGSDVLQVCWTPVFARGKVAIYVCDPGADGAESPARLNSANELACFVRNVLPQVLLGMQAEHGWSSLPRVVVHDKATYMVNSIAQLLNPVFSGALAEAGFRSWTGPHGSDTTWLASRLGDFYLHETVISHIRRLLMEKFVCLRVGETFQQFRRRMARVQDYMNSDEFRRQPDGAGFPGLVRDFLWRCEELQRRQGKRLAF